MRSLAVLFLLLSAGCKSSSSSNNGTPDRSLRKMVRLQQIFFDVSRARVGDWALYSGGFKGGPRYRFQYAIVSGNDKAIWVENRVPDVMEAMIIKSKWSRTGALMEEWIGPAGGKPVQTYGGSNAIPPPPSAGANTNPDVNSKEKEVEFKAAGKTYFCTRITTHLRSARGRATTMVNWCSLEVPFWVTGGTKQYGGLIRREFGDFAMQLVDHGNQLQRRELLIPE